MYLFKTSGSTYKSVIAYRKHAFKNKPVDWYPGEIVLVSKNQADLGRYEKQISYIMKMNAIRPLSDKECEMYWPGNKGRWEWVIDCYESTELVKPFDLNVVIGAVAARKFSRVMTFRRLEEEGENKVLAYIEEIKRAR